MAIIGIDLGTTNSACGVWTEQGVKLIPNRLGQFLTPSVVGIDDSGRITVGQVAKERLISHSDKTVAVFKRLMGTDHKVILGKNSFTATELSSLILSSLKEDAELFLKQPIESAVISVPAYFNDNQRHATKLAGELAGLKVDRLINEPTAAAMAYGLHDKKEGTFLILDLGGGTFDVTILEFFEGVMEVHASAGDNFLGGEDFLEAMLQDVLKSSALRKDQLTPTDLQRAYHTLEFIKCNLGKESAANTEMQIADKKLQINANEDWFAKITVPLLIRVKQPVEKALRDANLSPGEIDEIVLVGGATRMKIFRNNISRMFGRLPSCNLDPDLVVAMGASVQAGLMDKHEALNDIVLTDVCPYTLGTETVGPDDVSGGYFLPIIERNTTVPTSIVKTLQTVADNQRFIELKIFQGEHRMTEKNVFLGSLEVPVPKGPAGKERIDVRYSYDMNGLLEVDVKVLSSGKIYNKLIEQAPGMLSDEEKKKSLQKLSSLKFHPREQEENRMLIAKGERLFESALGEEREYISHLLAQFDAVLERQSPMEIKKAQEILTMKLAQFEHGDWF